MKDLLKFGFITMIILVIVGLLVSGLNQLIGQGIATMGFTFMVWCLIVKFKEFERKSK